MHPNGQRLEPLGASDEPTSEIVLYRKNCNKCFCLEEEKDQLQTSLFALTTHFAQVQFRLCQLVNAPFEEQEDLVKSLEQFAFTDVNFLGDQFSGSLIESIKKRRTQQRFLLARLKSHLKQLREFDVQTRRAYITRTELLDNLRLKENLEQQLRMQIADLERFIQYLKGINTKCSCERNKKSCRTCFFEIIERGFSFLQFAVFHFSWGFNSGQGNHWGDLRAKLELTIIDLKRMLRCKEDPTKITTVVRKGLATNIRDLMQHGTRSHNLTPFEFFSQTSIIHSWDIILYYYNFRKGDEFNSSTIQKLSRSFNIKIAGVSPKSNKKNLLYVIEDIVSTHSRYKRSPDSHFKAFVCAALNAKKLVTWLDQIFRCGSLIETFYHPWSYVATTKYEDGLKSLDVLTSHKFNLPVDLDVEKFRNDNVFA